MGRAFIFGDGINTDVLAPGSLMKLPPEELAQHCLEAIDPQFAKEVRPGDFVFAGRNFGQGSSREQAVVSLKLLGVSAVLATSFARIFYRNAMNLGLPAVKFDAVAEIKKGNEIDIDLVTGSLANRDTGKTYAIKPLPSHLMEMVEAGGLIPYLDQRLNARAF
ncbi:3-isopropylmalate dehydratase [Parasphingopyxis algicola]|uniref:LeuD/DmdB family oxidoreductase small subunit n=1 Tax=Parasphingopyxis algicola TaxID=2026624 RepID=UPI0015A4B1B1|nr:3-isopropylmalate dehydratase [Parasphingopyxis algicola]QLC26365.1 3-isopropylmalate dehydratase [Parasphingopyxis algicola]